MIFVLHTQHYTSQKKEEGLHLKNRMCTRSYSIFLSPVYTLTLACPSHLLTKDDVKSTVWSNGETVSDGEGQMWLG